MASEEVQQLIDTLSNWEKLKQISGSEIGRLQTVNDLLPQLKAAVQQGQLTMTEYFSVAEPLIQKTADSVGSIARVGRRQADSVNPIWTSLQNQGFVSPVNGKWTVQVPFSRREYAQLPENVLPTRDDVNKGLFEPTLAPMERYRQNLTPTSNPTQPANPAINPGLTAPGSQPLPSAPETVTSPRGGLHGGTTEAGIDENKILAEAELAKQLRQQTLEQTTTARKKMLSDLSGSLQRQQQAALSDQMPGIYEDMNSRGLLRSSELGSRVAQENAKLSRDTSERLAQATIDAEGADINALPGIMENYLGSRGSAVSRRFSLEDFGRQIEAGKTLGAAAIPQISQPSGKGSGAITGASAGAQAGAATGNPWATAGGALIGGVTGGQLGDKKRHG